MPANATHRLNLVARLGISLFVLLHIVAVFSALVLICELFLVDAILGRTEASTRPNPEADELVRRGYYPAFVKVDPYHHFEELYPHPTYGYYWPMNKGRVVPRSNGVVSLDHHGFRGAWSQKDRLAFLLGGSAAFGYRSSSDETTITGWLNKFQKEFQFVNAGVPSAPSASEAARLAEQIVSFKPQLVISYSLFNDIELTIEFIETGPENSNWWDSLAWIIPNTARLLEILDRRFLLRTDQKPQYQPSRERLESAIDGAVDTFIRNQQRMSALGVEKHFRFVTVIQPMTQTHENTTIKGRHPELFRRAVQRARATDYCRLSCIDYSAVFDGMFGWIPVLFEGYNTPALTDAVNLRDVVFADQCHLLDTGNAIVARKLAADLDLIVHSPERSEIAAPKAR
jgi:hypothetical protein